LIEVVTGAARRREKLDAIHARSVSADAELTATVARIVEDVRRRGDAALVEYAARFDGVSLPPSELRVEEGALRESAARVDARVLEAVRASVRNVRAFHEREMVGGWEFEAARGVRLGQRVTPVEAAGLYVPGGTASYPSSVVMNVVPAQVAGVARVAVVTPPRTLSETPAVAATLLELGVTEVYQVGGAHAVAALAYGTETIPRVDVITGPGNKYVAAAKRLVYGAVGIDSVAGPSEVVVLADESARADFIAADLLAQAEHGEDASAVLVTTDPELAQLVAAQVALQAATLPRKAIVERSLADFGAVFVVNTIEEACDIVNGLAPEHLEIMTREPEAWAARVRHAGAIFYGEHTPEAVGDYIAGPNHVLPTGGASRFSSALGVHNFLRRTSVIRYTREELRETAPLIAALAEAEGLDAHARSALIRLRPGGGDES
jgi:histidinol dehydrogenase